MKAWRVVWEIEVYAHDPEDAARMARHYQTAPNTTADVFDVFDETGERTCVDLTALDEEKETRVLEDSQRPSAHKHGGQ